MRRLHGVAATVTVAVLALGGLNWAAAQADRLVIGLAADPSGLDPRLVTDTVSLMPIHAVLEPLVALGHDLALVPRLARGWEVADDALSITFHLRPGVRFHHGTTLSSEDVRFTFETLLDPESGSPQRALFATLERIETPDDRTVVFRLRAPNAALVSRVARVPILPADMGTVPALFAQRPYGTGPYRFDSWVRGDRLTLRRFDGYWGGAGGVEMLEFRVIPDLGKRLAALEAGDVDIVPGPFPPGEAERVAADPDIEFHVTPAVGYTYLGFNTRVPPLDDARVRRALSKLIAREAIVEQLMLGQAVVGLSMFATPTPWFDPEADHAAHDPELARALLAEAEPEFAEPLRLLTNDQELRLALAETLAEVFAAEGVAVEVVAEEFTAYLDRLHRTDEYELFLLGWSDQLDPERATTRQLHSGALGTTNYAYYANPRVDALLEQALSTDPASDEGVAIYREVDRIVAADAPHAFLFHEVETALYRSDVRGWRVHPRAASAFQDAHRIRLAR